MEKNNNMKIEEIIFSCWQENNIANIDKNALDVKLEEIWSCLKKTFSSLRINDQISVMVAYLNIIGYKNIIVIDQKEAIISINYSLPGQVSLNGLATISPTFLKGIIKNINDIDFGFVFCFNNIDLDLNVTNKIKIIKQNDLANIFGQIIAMKFYRKYSTIKGSPIAENMKNILNLMEKKWNISLDMLEKVIKSWNTFSDEKIEYESSLSK
jgi:hypothetical protein